MLDVMLVGACGKMGRIMAGMIEQEENMRVVCGVDIIEYKDSEYKDSPFPMYTDPFVFEDKAGVIIDFTRADGLEHLLDYAVKTRTPAVIATTGLDAAHKSAVSVASRTVPIFMSANMSLGVNLLIQLVKKAAASLGGFDIEIVEKHHNTKLDAPSGTAVMLAEAAESALPYQPRQVFDRHSVRRKREPNEIGMHAIRGGTIVGEHDVIFAGHDEIVTLSHSARSRDVFAAGAIAAARFIATMPPGLYSMDDLIGTV